jgi:hypothetical protein
MRQGQQNRRGRGRGGRKPQNPLARNYESNGPDVKIRGTAAHIAEKYMSLARDALASGDLVGAESYLQHAEHYNRIIMAAQTQFGGQPGLQQGGEGPNGSYRAPTRWNSEGSDDDGDYDEGGGDIRQGGGDVRQGGEGQGGQDRQRHAGDREHHPGGRDRNRHGGNGRESGRDRDGNGTDQPETHQPDDTAPDPVS